MGSTLDNRAFGHTTAFATLLAALLALLAFAPGASAFKVLSELGEGAGQTREPRGLAVEHETGRLYVADAKNNRVSVFDSGGSFEMAFGWGVKNGAAELQVCTSATTCRAGLPGLGAGQLNRPTAIAVDNDPASSSFQDVYVFDNENKRIVKFDQDGNFILSFGSPGEGEGQFPTFNTFVAVAAGGDVHVVDNLGTEQDAKTRIQRFQPSGALIGTQQILQPEEYGPESMALDSSGNVFLATAGEGKGGLVRKYAPSGGLPVGQIDTPNGGLQSIGIDSADNLFVSSASAGTGQGAKSSITEYDSSGNPLRTFGYGSFQNWADAIAPYHSASGEIYAAEGEGGGGGWRVIHIDVPPPGPLIVPQPCKASPLGNTKATLKAEINPEGKATTYRFQYISDDDFIANGGSFSGPNPASSTPESESIGSDFELHQASAEVELIPETKYHCRVVATNADAPGGVTGPEGTFTALEPLEIGATWTSEVATEAATLNAEVNPLGIPTTAHFEYVDEATYQKDVEESGPDHGFDHATKAPAGEEIDLGAGESFKAASVSISGLSPATTYRYRIVASDSLIAPDPPPNEVAGPTKAFRTYRAGEGGLPDQRAWELVSPGLKNSAEVAIPSYLGGIYNTEVSVRIQAAADSGEAVTYTSWTSFGEAKGAPGTSHYLSQRTASGWGTENITPFGTLGDPLRTPYRGFNPDLGFGAFLTSEPPLTGEAQVGSENLYLRNSDTGALQALTTEAPQLSAGQAFCTGYAGASADGKHAIFAASGAMAGAPVGKGFSLYEWAAGSGLRLVSVLPDGTPAAPIATFENAGVGTGFGGMGSVCTMGQGIVRNSISADGSTIFWAYGGKYKSSDKPLMARIDGAETIQLDAKPSVGGGSGPFGGGKFLAASVDGAKAFFTAPGKLTSSAAAGGQIYRYDTVDRALANLTPGAVAPEVEGVVGASEDGTHLYFVAKGALSGEEENAAHQKALKGAHNLYLWHEGEGVRFIAALSELDSGTWETAPEKLRARVSPDGRNLGFLSVEAEALSGYNNAIFPGAGCQLGLEDKLQGDPRCAEAYLYSAEADTLTCVSCNPSGSRPTGPTQLPSWSNPFEGPRYLSDDGSRFYFESRDVLSSADENQSRDVYQYERAGAGGCDAQSPTFVSATGGCLALISSGRDDDESYFLDASSSGRDVFFSTRDSLVGWDNNDSYDVYDAREGGGFPEPTALPICEAEACKGPPATVPPGAPSPATATFQGPGNASGGRPRCSKGKVRRKARCVKRQRHGKPQRKSNARRKRG